MVDEKSLHDDVEKINNAIRNAESDTERLDYYQIAVEYFGSIAKHELDMKNALETAIRKKYQDKLALNLYIITKP